MTVSLDLDQDAAEEVTEKLEAFGAIQYTAEYAVHVNYDTAWTTKKPPFKPLRKWVGRKWNDLSTDLKTDAEGDPLSKDEVTWKVINIIATYGIEGIHFAERALTAGENAADSLARQYQGSDDPDASYKIVQDVIDLMFGESQDIIADEAFDTGNLLQSGQVEVSREPIGEGES